MTGRLAGKIALVMGAGSIAEGWSNGKAAAVLFAREGATVYCVDINAASAGDTAGVIASEGGTAAAGQANVASSAEVKAVVDNCMARFGRIDVLHNNVGIVLPGGVVELEEEAWDRAFDVNLKGCYLAMKYVIPHMLAQGGGSIINVSSIASLRYLGTNYVAYYTTKAAMNHMTRVTAAEYASRQIRINAVLPGLMDTPMAKKGAREMRGVPDNEMEKAWRDRAARIPMGWMGDAWDVARAALFFASDDARFITGAELVVDGGLTLRS
jgi:NAD(P)-dependent dehydrogenase (short-subunit alcohol dehydrogenase family)